MKPKIYATLLVFVLLLALFQPVNAQSLQALPVERQVYEYLTQELELNSAAACGVLANIEHESAFQLTVLGDSGTSFGLCQWHNGRYSALINFCNSQGLDYQSVEGQMRYLAFELKTGYFPVLANLRHVDNSPEGAYQAAYIWCVQFERPANMEYQAANRAATAQFKYWNRYNASSISTVSMPIAPVERLADSMAEAVQDAGQYRVNPAPTQKTTWEPTPVETSTMQQEESPEKKSSGTAQQPAAPAASAPSAQRIYWKEFPVRHIFRAAPAAPVAPMDRQLADRSTGIAIGLGLMPLGECPRRRSAMFIPEEELSPV